MIVNLLCPGLLETGPVSDSLLAVRDGMVNFYILKAPTGLVCIDTGWRPARVLQSFERLGLNIKSVMAVLVTHLHWDHAGCLSLFPQAQAYVGAAESTPFFAGTALKKLHLKLLNEDLSLSAGGIPVRAVHTPGHTAGSFSYVIDNHWLFTGDTLRLQNGIVRPFLPWFNHENTTLHLSLRKLAALKGMQCLLTSHSGISRAPQQAFVPWTTPDNTSQTRLGLS